MQSPAREPIPDYVVKALVRPEWANEVKTLLASLSGNILEYSGLNIQIQGPGVVANINPCDTPDTPIAKIPRAELLSFLKDMAATQAETKDPNALRNRLIKIIEAEEDRIRTEMHVPDILDAYCHARAQVQRLRTWCLALGITMGVLSVGMLAANHLKDIKKGADEAADMVGKAVDAFADTVQKTLAPPPSKHSTPPQKPKKPQKARGRK